MLTSYIVTIFFVFFKLTQANTVTSSDHVTNMTTVNRTCDVAANETQKDAILLEIEYLQRQIDLDSRKLSTLQHLYSYYVSNRIKTPVPQSPLPTV